MGQEEIINLLRKKRRPMSLREIAKILSRTCNYKSTSHCLKLLLEQKEIEIDHVGKIGFHHAAFYKIASKRKKA